MMLHNIICPAFSGSSFQGSGALCQLFCSDRQGFTLQGMNQNLIVLPVLILIILLYFFCFV